MIDNVVVGDVCRIVNMNLCAILMIGRRGEKLKEWAIKSCFVRETSLFPTLMGLAMLLLFAQNSNHTRIRKKCMKCILIA